jgi:hypothetical protein
MIAEDGRLTAQESESAVTAQRAVLEQRTRLRKLLRGAMVKVDAAVMGGQQPIRPIVAAVHQLAAEHFAEADALREELAEAVAGLEVLRVWPEDEDEIELALRFQTLATVLLQSMTSDLSVDDPFGC